MKSYWDIWDYDLYYCEFFIVFDVVLYYSRCLIDICWINEYTFVEIKIFGVARVGFTEKVVSYLDYYGVLIRMLVLVKFLLLLLELYNL